VNFDLSDEQQALREAARGALSRHDTLAAARDGADGGERLDLWDLAREMGWPGLLVSEEQGGAGLGALDAMLVMVECGRVLASVGLLGHVAATALLDVAGAAEPALAEGERRAALVPAQPPGDLDDGWTVEAVQGQSRPAAPSVDAEGRVSGAVAWVPDAPGADVLVVVAVDDSGTARAVVVEADGDGVTVEEARRYDYTRSLGHVRLEGARGQVLDLDQDALAAAWFLVQSLIAAESLGAVETALETSVAYAKERFTFGRAIGSYQAVKHGLTEVLRQLENARSLLYYAGWARQDAPAEFPLAASAARTAAGEALDFAAREMISVHGGIGATWEHDAPYYFRRAQVSRRLLGGTTGSADRVAGELLRQARATAPA
jgi:alkylation response protein AidB-like acyl-CoA dehydrogenase